MNIFSWCAYLMSGIMGMLLLAVQNSYQLPFGARGAEATQWLRVNARLNTQSPSSVFEESWFSTVTPYFPSSTRTRYSETYPSFSAKDPEPHTSASILNKRKLHTLPTGPHTPNLRTLVPKNIPCILEPESSNADCEHWYPYGHPKLDISLPYTSKPP